MKGSARKTACKRLHKFLKTAIALNVTTCLL
jgi:hypothetical protein